MAECEDKERGVLNYYDVLMLIEDKMDKEVEKDKERGVEREMGDIENEVGHNTLFVTMDTVNEIKREIEKSLQESRKYAEDDKFEEGRYTAFEESIETISQLTEDYDENGKN